MNKNDFDKSFDEWFYQSPEERAQSNFFLELLGTKIKDWPQVPKVDYEEKKM